MKPGSRKPGSRKRTLVTALAAVGLSLVVLTGATVRKLRTERAYPEQLVAAMAKRGVLLELGKVSYGLFGIAIEGSRFSLRDHEARGVIHHIDIDCPWVVPTAFMFRDIQAFTRGEPGVLYDAARSLLGDSPVRVGVEGLALDYEHPVTGLLSLKDLSVRRSTPELVLRAGSAELAGASFSNVTFSLGRRGDFFEVGLGESGGGTDAKLKLSHYSTPGGRSEWLLSIAHQSLSDLLTSLGWSIGPELETTAMVGTLSLATRPDEPRPVGQLRLTFDRWPKPAWPEVDARLGRSAALFARIETEQDAWHFSLPYIDITLPSFHAKGTGRLVPLGPKAMARFDVRGTETCRVIAGRAGASGYRDRLEAFVAAQPPSSASLPREEQPSAELRIQLDATGGSSPHAKLALALGGGCGLESMTASTFEALDVPAFEPVSRRRPVPAVPAGGASVSPTTR